MQVLKNFPSSAARLSVLIKFTGKRDSATIRVGCANENGETAYFVQDNGIGFDMEYSGKLFQLFQRLHSDTEFEGTGIGLAIVQRIFRRHEGTVWAQAQPGQGATFFFNLKEQGHEQREQGHPAG